MAARIIFLSSKSFDSSSCGRKEKHTSGNNETSFLTKRPKWQRLYLSMQFYHSVVHTHTRSTRLYLLQIYPHIAAQICCEYPTVLNDRSRSVCYNKVVLLTLNHPEL